MNQENSRRAFLKSSALASMGVAVGSQAVEASGINLIIDNPEANSGKSLVFLFQGDSITDGNRGRSKDPNHIMGHGYAFAVAGRIGADFAEAGHSFYNRGISGNKVTDLKQRWQPDTLELKPDVLSILVGINDAAALVKKEMTSDSDLDAFEMTYRDILLLSKAQNPDIIFVLCFPFVYPVEKLKDQWDKYSQTIAQLSARISSLAAEFNAVLVDFSGVFEQAFGKAPVEYWIWDGIHPTVPAHELMAREWIRMASSRLPFLKQYNHGN
jgi:lysophospholipase L1-like esterase